MPQFTTDARKNRFSSDGERALAIGTPTEPSRPNQVAWSVRGWCESVSLSPAYVYELLAAGTITSVKIGGKRLITTSPRDFLAALAEAA